MDPIVNIIENLESLALSFKPVLQVFLGLVCIVIGLVSWLAGLKLKRAYVPLTVMLIAALVCHYLTEKNMKITSVVAGITFIAFLFLQFVFVRETTFWNVLLSVVFSLLGTVLVFTGLIFLMTFEGSSPAAVIFDRPISFAAVFVSMVIFGIVLQVIVFAGAVGYLKNESADDMKNLNNQGE
jgi:hypothetical protein